MTHTILIETIVIERMNSEYDSICSNYSIQYKKIQRPKNKQEYEQAKDLYNLLTKLEGKSPHCLKPIPPTPYFLRKQK
jgi:hypothetical protein